MLYMPVTSVFKYSQRRHFRQRILQVSSDKGRRNQSGLLSGKNGSCFSYKTVVEYVALSEFETERVMAC